MGEEASPAASSSVAGGGKGAEGAGKAKAAPASKEDAKNAAPSGSDAGKQPAANGEAPPEADGEDKPADADADSIPRATSAPPLLEEFQKAYGPADEAAQVKPFTDIRLDEDYEEFYKKYSRVKKLPPPVENRHLYAGVTNSPKRAPPPGQGQTPFVGKPSEGSDEHAEGSGAPWAGQDGAAGAGEAGAEGSGGSGKGKAGLPKSQSDSQAPQQGEHGEGLATKEEMEAHQEKIKEADAALSVGLSRLRVRDSPRSAAGVPGAEGGKEGAGEAAGTGAETEKREGTEQEAGDADLSSVAALVDSQGAGTLNGPSTDATSLRENPSGSLPADTSNTSVSTVTDVPSGTVSTEDLTSMDPAQAAALALLQGSGIPGAALPGVPATGLPGMPPVGPGGAGPPQGGLVGWEGLMAAAMGGAGMPGAGPGGLLPDLSGIPGAAGGVPPGAAGAGPGGMPGVFPMAAVAAAAGLPSAAGIAPSNMHLYEQLLRARLGPSMDLLASLQPGMPQALGVPNPPGGPMQGGLPGLEALGALGGMPNLQNLQGLQNMPAMGGPGPAGMGPPGLDLLSALQAARLLPGAPGIAVGMPGQMPGPGFDLMSAAATLAAIQGGPGAPLDMDALLQLQRAQQIAALQAQLQAPLDGAGKPVGGTPGEGPRPFGGAPDGNQHQALLQLLQQQQQQQNQQHHNQQQQQGQQQQMQQQMMNQASGLPPGLSGQMRNPMGGMQGHGHLGFGGAGGGQDFGGLGGDRLGPTGRGSGHRNRDGSHFHNNSRNSNGNGNTHSTSNSHSSPCRFFMQSGFCARGDSCPFSHALPGQGGPPSGAPQRGGRGGGGGKGRVGDPVGGGYTGSMPADPWQASRASPPFGGGMPFGGLPPGGVPPVGMPPGGVGMQGGPSGFGGPHMMPGGRGPGLVPGGNGPGAPLGANGVFPFAPGVPGPGQMGGQMGGQMDFSPLNPMGNLGQVNSLDAYAALQSQLAGAGMGGLDPSLFNGMGSMGLGVNQHGGLGFNQAPGPGVANLGAGRGVGGGAGLGGGAGGLGVMGLGSLGSLPGGLGLGGNLGPNLGVGANVPLKYASLAEVEGRMATVARDQHGCRFLQRQLDEGPREDINKIYGEIREALMELMTDPFGNYLVQKLLEVCSRAQQVEVLAMVTQREGELVNISLNMHGTRSVQKLIEMLTSEEDVARITGSLEGGVVTLIKDLNGNHVVQRCLQRLSCRQNEFIFKAAVARCVEVATHRHGCCVLQRCVDFADEGQRARLVLEIAANTLSLAQDPFGNYVVQYVLDLGLPWAVEEVTARILGHIPTLATQKFSSNVVEKCLKSAPDASRQAVVLELVTTPALGQLLQDPFANYVIQSALSVAKGNLYAAFVDAIRPHVPALRSSPYGKRILSKTNLKPR